MGCSSSKLDNEEAVQLCKDRKNFVKEALEQRSRFASGHLAYIHSLKRVSAALRDYIEGDEPREFSLDSFITPVKKPNPGANGGFISITPKKLLPEPNVTINYLRSGGNPTVLVEERPRSPERVQIYNYASPAPAYGVDGFFATPNPYFGYDSYHRYTPPPPPLPQQLPPPSPRTSQWDFFWNPFSSLDNYGYPTRNSLGNETADDERQVREEEGIPELEEETEHEECDHDEDDVRDNMRFGHREEVVVEDIDDEDEDEDDDDDDDEDEEIEEIDCGHCGDKSGALEVKQPQGEGSKVEIVNKQERAVVGDDKKSEEKPGFTVYVNKRPTSMAEVIRDLDSQFVRICDSAGEVSRLLEVGKAHHSPSNEHSAMKMLNPVALFRSGSSRSTSSRFLISSSSTTPTSKDESGYDSNSDFSEDSGLSSSSHQSTLDRLYAWEKKLYEEVKSGEKVRIAYEKKCMQLRNQDVKGDDPSSVDKTRTAIRDLHTQIKVSIHSVEAISKRIETLRDEELQPQLADLVQGLSRMWTVMSECHRSQKRTLDEAKVLLAGTPSKLEARRRSHISITDPFRLARSASNLETELRNWKTCFELWIGSQRSYLRSLTGWLLRCVRKEPETSGKFPFSPRRSSGTLPIFGLCIQWSRFLDSLQEMPVLDGLDFFAAGMGSIYEQQMMKDDSRRVPGGSKRFGFDAEQCMDIVEVGEVEEVMTAEKMADVAIRVLCAGMSVAVSSLTEFAIGSADGYAVLVDQWEQAKWRKEPGDRDT